MYETRMGKKVICRRLLPPCGRRECSSTLETDVIRRALAKLYELLFLTIEPQTSMFCGEVLTV